jgi:hypothetical protein
MKKSVLILALLFMIPCSFLFSQEDTKWKGQFQIGGDIMSRYIWRGLNLGGDGVSIQPAMKFSAGNPNHLLSLGAWGAYTFSPTANQEMDLTASYTFKSLLTVSVTDYFFPGLFTGQRDKYFYYKQDTTGHVFEGAVQFSGTEKIPFTLFIATNFYGNDARKMKEINDSTFVNDGIQYSTYIELGFFKSIKGFNLNAFVGGTVNNPDESLQETGYYGNTKPGITNVGIKLAKTISISEKFAFGLQTSLIANPMQNKIYLVFGISL